MKPITQAIFLASLLLAGGPTLAEDGVFNHLGELAKNPELLAEIASQTQVLAPDDARILERGFLAGGAVSVIPAAAFSSDEVSPDSLFFSFGSGQMRGNSNGVGCVKARLYVRNDIDILQFSVTVRDDAPVEDFFMNLYRVQSFDGGVDTLASVATSGQSASLQVLNDNSIVDATVSQPDYSYYVAGCLIDADISLLSARVFYDIDLFSDGFESGDTSAWDSVVQ